MAGRRVLAAVAALVFVGIVGFGFVIVRAAPAASVVRVDTDGLVSAFFGGCDFFVPPGPVSCHETSVLGFREAREDRGGSVNARSLPWFFVIDDYTVTFTSADPNVPPVFSNERFGSVELTSGVDMDLQHLDTATVTDAQVPMDDGSTFTFSGTWTKRFEVTYGNDGPENADEGIPRHFVDNCVTFNANAHQKIAFASMTGTLNGQPVQSYHSFDFAATLSNDHYRYITASHGGSCAS
jgi:hypothetical protein